MGKKSMSIRGGSDNLVITSFVGALILNSGDVTARGQFSNGYGYSVIRNSFSYGGRSGLFELAVLDSYGELTYSTPITGDVLGYLTPEEVGQALRQIAAL